MTQAILVINAGSSSSKFSVYTADNGDLDLIVKGQVEGIGVGIQPHFQAKDASGAVVADELWPMFEVGKRHASLLRLLIDWIESHMGGATLAAVGHRVVHGGHTYGAPVLIEGEVLDNLHQFVSLAPLHQPHNLGPIRTIAELHPGLPQVACFDTAFHMTKRQEAWLFGLPRHYLDEGIRRYGFHGLSYEFIAHKLKDVAPQVADGRVIVAHLGSGASMCALKGGQSVDSSMGFTAVEGLMMGTRTGSLDPGVILHLMQTENLDAKGLEKLLYKESGLLGVSRGISNDMRILLDSPRQEAKQAVDLFIYRIAKEIGALAATIGGIDALVFTAGIGEHSAVVRSRVMDLVAWMGIQVDATANAGDGPCLTTADSPVSAWAIPTDEELMIARHTRRIALAG